MENLNKYSVNYELFLDELVNAYSLVLGIQYKDLIAERLKKIKIINYFTDSHLNNYLIKIGKQTEKIENYNSKKYLKYYESECINELRKKFPENVFFTTINFFPFLSYSKLYDFFGEFRTKRSILEDLNLLEKVNGYGWFTGQKKIDYENITNETWDKYFCNVNLEDLIQITKRFSLAYSKTETLSQGNIKECIEFGKNIYNSGEEVFNVNDIISQSNLKCCRTVVKMEERDIIIVVINPILYLYNSEMLISIIHEITHGLSNEKILVDPKKWEIKSGFTKYYLTGVDTEKEEVYNYFNEAVTQYIATEVSKILLEKNIERDFFTFEIPNQEANLYSSYPGCMKFGKDFIEKNKGIIFSAYIQNSDFIKLCEMIDMKMLEDLFQKSFSSTNNEEIEQLKSKINV